MGLGLRVTVACSFEAGGLLGRSHTCHRSRQPRRICWSNRVISGSYSRVIRAGTQRYPLTIFLEWNGLIPLETEEHLMRVRSAVFPSCDVPRLLGVISMVPDRSTSHAGLLVRGYGAGGLYRALLPTNMCIYCTNVETSASKSSQQGKHAINIGQSGPCFIVGFWVVRQEGITRDRIKKYE